MKKTILFITILFCCCGINKAQPGFLDNSFGVSGIAMSPFVSNLSYGNALAIQPDGKIIVTGRQIVGIYFKTFVVRYTSTGSFDPAFTNLVTSNGSYGEYGKAIAVQNDGKIVIAGDFINTFFNEDFMLLRLLPSGLYDTSFGNGGIVTLGFSANSVDETFAMAIQPDGKIIIVGSTYINPIDQDIALLRFNTDGSPDSTFGTNGKVSTDINNQMQEGYDMLLQPDGKIVVAGRSSTITTASDLAVYRYLSNGSPDSTFGSNGVSIPGINFDDDDAGKAVALQPDGKIIVSGYTYTNFTFTDNLIVRLDTLGNVDSTFNGTGILITNNCNNENMSTGILLQSDGKIVTTGRGLISNLEFTLSRFNSNGIIDSTFGNNGHVFTDIAGDTDDLFASLIQPDGKIVVTGYYTDSGIENFLVARYLNDPALSVSEPYTEDEFLLFPQPANDRITIQLNNTDKNEEYLINIYSVNSELVQSLKSTGNMTEIDISLLNSGMYYMNVSDGKQKKILGKMFVKARK